ncbi:MAG: alginate export family protein [Leptospiraceae bacterium]|nr:alginate export family protein [Leptospiraceae bacterium]
MAQYTTNTFQGTKITLGKDQNNWSIDFLALKPLERLTNETDKPVRNQLFGGGNRSYPPLVEDNND